MDLELFPRQAGNSRVSPIENGWRLEIPAGDRHNYRLAQLDDYVLSRRDLRFLHTPPWQVWLRARVSQPNLPGTWGFGLWNDPFGFALGFGGTSRHIPTLPQTAWFFHAGEPNWLSLRDGTAPGSGFFAGTFRSARIPSPLFIAGVPAIPLLAWRPSSRWLRRLASRIIHQDGNLVDVDVTQWHDYSIRWDAGECSFEVDGQRVLSTPVSPPSPLGLVIWIDNQYARWTPEGRLGYGVLENPSAWLEIKGLKVK